MKKTEEVLSSYALFKTRFGPVAVVWSVYRGQPKIRRLVLPEPEVSAKQLVNISFPEATFSSCVEVDGVVDQIAAFLAGHHIRFSMDMVRLDVCSRFQQKVLRAEHGIPWGHVSTYQRIASYLGNANGARAVGTALANNPFPLMIPCHRVIRSDGRLGGYQGGLKMKRALLEMEGIPFDPFGRVIAAAYCY